MSQNSLFRNILHILTPEAISELTSLGTSSSKEAITSLLKGYNEGHEIEVTSTGNAKIIAFPTPDEIPNLQSSCDVDKEIKAGEKVDKYINHFVTKVRLESLKIGEDATPVETSTFIINEKERFKYVYAKLKKQEVLDLYEKNSVVDLEQERQNKKDLSKNSSSGVLINKKHY